MPPLLLGAIAAVCIGISDTFGRASSRRASSISHVATMMFVGIFVSIPLLLLIDSSFRIADAASGALSGLCVGVGLSVVYRAMADSSSAIAAPTAGVIAVMFPLFWDLLLNDASLSALTGLGCAVAIASLAVVTYNPQIGMATTRSGLGKAVVGGIFFGLAIIFAADTSVESGVWPAASQRLFAFVAMMLVAFRAKVPVFLPRSMRNLGLWAGISGAVGMSSLVIGSQQGDLGTVSVVASTYPAVIVVLSTLFDDDQIRWWQAIGVAGAVAGTILIALG